MRKIIRIFLFFFCLFFIIPAGFSVQNDSADKLPKDVQYVQEPVFNGNVYIYISGNQLKTTVILVYGVGSDASDIWKGLVPILEKQYRVICFDLPGFGRSDKSDRIQNVNAASLTITNSWINIENICIKSDKTAVNVIDSNITVTGGSIEGDTGILTSNSKIDLAGVNIISINAAVSTGSDSASTFIFSICEIKSNFNDKFIHDIVEVSNGNPL